VKNKIAIITGAGRGIGKGIAEKFANEGYICILIARNSNETKKVAEKLKIKNSQVYFEKCDIIDEESVKMTISKIVKKFGRIDILVNSAASGPAVGPSDNLSLNDWNKVIGTDLTGTFIFCKEVGKIMIKKKFGRIINISSFHSIATYPERVAYASAKTGVIGLTRALAVEWGKYGITVNAVSPGPIKTPRTNYFLGLDPNSESQMLKRTPLGRLGEVKDVSGLVSYLVSDEAGFLTGQNIVIDGGWLSSAWFGQY